MILLPPRFRRRHYFAAASPDISSASSSPLHAAAAAFAFSPMSFSFAGYIAAAAAIFSRRLMPAAA
jgi:hypothetical protein